MKYRILLCDIDGTLRPFSSPIITEENKKAIQTLQNYGVKFVISTGRSRMTIPEEMMNGIVPDYWICAAGSQVLDREGKEIELRRFPKESVEHLTEYCMEKNYLLRFVFSDGIYVYAEYDTYAAMIRERKLLFTCINGEDHTRHLSELPYGATGMIPREGAEEYNLRYPRDHIRFAWIRGDHCDILFPSQSKAEGLKILLKQTGITMAECVSIGDGDNDVELLLAAGMSYCVEGGSDSAMKAAKRICPLAENSGPAWVCKTLWPQAFAEVKENI